MNKLLFIGSGAPWLGGAGYLIRQRMFLRALAEVAELHLAMFDVPAGARESMPEFVRSLTELPKVPRIGESGLARLRADLFSSQPRMFRGPRPDEARKVVADLKPRAFDAIFAFRIDFAHFAGVLGQPRLLLDIDDPEHLRWRRQLEATTATGGDWRTRRDLDKLARFEKQASRNALASFVCQEHDRAAFDPPPIVVPNCVDVPPACPSRNVTRPRIIFLGNCAPASPNCDGLTWMLKDIWPLIHGQLPEAELFIAGKLGAELEARVRQTPGAISGGFVSDLPAAMSAASLSIAPIRFGTGTRVKIIESFALGCPVVSTTLGAEGLDAKAGEQILIGDGAEDFANQCIALLRNSSLQTMIAASAFDLASSRYSEGARRPQLVATLQELLNKATTPVAASRSIARKAALL